MRKNYQGCDQTLSARYLDGELTNDEQAVFKGHLGDCPSCRTALEDYRSVAALFKEGVSEAARHADFDALGKRVLDLARRESKPWWIGIKDFFFSWRLLVPTTAVAASFILFSLLFGPSSHNSRPSAIVNSFTGETSSVMILETSGSHQTIIWFNELNTQGGMEDASQESFNNFSVISCYRWNNAQWGTGSTSENKYRC